MPQARRLPDWRRTHHQGLLPSLPSTSSTPSDPSGRAAPAARTNFSPAPIAAPSSWLSSTASRVSPFLPSAQAHIGFPSIVPRASPCAKPARVWSATSPSSSSTSSATNGPPTTPMSPPWRKPSVDGLSPAVAQTCSLLFPPTCSRQVIRQSAKLSRVSGVGGLKSLETAGCKHALRPRRVGRLSRSVCSHALRSAYFSMTR